jgi:hypothetical protein
LLIKSVKLVLTQAFTDSFNLCQQKCPTPVVTCGDMAAFTLTGIVTHLR